MSANTNIEWCDHTFNPWTGCTKVSPGCDHCYAEGWAKRSGQVQWGPHAARRRTSPANWSLPRRWNAQAEAFAAQHGRRQRVFCASLADVFDNAVPIAWFAEFLDLCRLTPNLDKLLLTKRIGNVERRLAEASEYAAEVMRNPLLANWIVTWLDGDAPPDIWLGTTIVNQPEADRDIMKLLAVPASVRFLSMEPLLGPVIVKGLFALDWVIVGGESGPGARPMHIDWARGLRDQCEAARVPFLFKQWGEWGMAVPQPSGTKGRYLLMADHGSVMGSVNVPLDAYPRQFTAFGSTVMERVGKKAAGRLLDGREWNGVPA
ncbi:phage Gp37/Gp68 family protein [Acidovorax sp. BLS4]|uniref:phage Gp37/Gp68 family protein n=1 Tax=Acidovorax sp. BLS4 TaxID=3273430 RepID=UPI002942C29D|nr:phage Gp37/Gp68 family protein [Paracidovorax avenae]WOI45885.1 phage Gp37/Gp68 family protein [Paracidovorax avenae]